ncbi:MAG: HAD-IIB family hydrolase [Gammaproteobacteria bacterium]|nr:HAD-IIB family hydrolase [Gammaproteobacteria bacterium]
MEASDAPNLLLISVHGLIRGHQPELGRDADTGGQVKYVLELAEALAARDDVGRVDLVTRLIEDPSVGPDYAVAEEPLAHGARLVRIPCGPAGYIVKEQLWDHLDGFADNLLEWLHGQPAPPDLVHSHYADAGYVGTLIARQLDIPLVHTGHSLGRVKRRRLLAGGMEADEIETRFNMARRINGEEATLAVAELIVTSTRQEIDEQYALYDGYVPERMKVIPPGVDLGRYHPPGPGDEDDPLRRKFDRFLNDPDKPCVLALSRLDRRKNNVTLVEAFGASPELRARANLWLLIGTRDDPDLLDDESRLILDEILHAIDRHDLYGEIAYPKRIDGDDIPACYRLAAALDGVFVNPALTEPFGLTLLEAAASGLPLVSTEDGGPRDIVANCRNGELVDPLDTEAIAAALLGLLDDRERRARCVDNGLAGVREHYSWEAHAASYREAIAPLLDAERPSATPVGPRREKLHHDRALFTDLDLSLLGDPDALAELVALLQRKRKACAFAISSGRRLDAALRLLRKHGIPQPDVLITSLGTAIHYAPNLTEDTSWRAHIDRDWNPAAVRRALRELPGLEAQADAEQSRFKLSWYIDPARAPEPAEIESLLRKAELAANPVFSFGQYLDVVPSRASKGFALRWVAHRWGIPLERVLATGGSGADADMLRGNTLGVVVANRHREELADLTELDQVYLAAGAYAAGILEAIDHYRLFDDPGGAT